MRISIALLALLPLSLSGCGLLAGTAAGVVLAQEVIDNSTFVVQVKQPTEVVWEEVKVSMSKQAKGPLEVDEALLAVIGSVDSRTVTVSVESFDQDTSRLMVYATHYGVSDGKAADKVTQQLIKDIEANAQD